MPRYIGFASKQLEEVGKWEDTIYRKKLIGHELVIIDIVHSDSLY